MVLGTIAMLFGSFSYVQADTVWPKECQGKEPHYLTGFTQTKDQIDAFFQMQQNYRMSQADSANRAVRATNLGEYVKLTFYGHTLTLYLPMYRQVGNTVYFHTASGVTPLTVQEFECVKADLKQWIQSAVDADYDDHKMITTIAVESFGKRNNMTPEAVYKLLAKQVPEYGTNYADVLKIPLLEPVDFIRSVKYMYFTAMGSCNATVYVKTVVALTPCVRRMDHIIGYPTVMKHELIHANIKLQGYPIAWHMNYELFAALLPFLEQPTNLDDFFYHTYLSTPWEILKVFGRWDIQKVRQEIFRYVVAWRGSAMNREVLAGYLAEINEAAKWLRETGLQALAEFYSDPHAWAAVNDMFYDDDMAYKAIMAKNWEPTLLKGHANTVKFILKHADQSKSIAERAMERVGKDSKGFEDDRRVKALGEYLKLAEALGFSKDELVRMGRAHGYRIEHFERMDLDMMRQLMNDFLKGEGMFEKRLEVR